MKHRAYCRCSFICNSVIIITARVSEHGRPNEIGRVCPLVRLFSFYFRTNWPLIVIFLWCTHSSPGIKNLGQGQGLGLKLATIVTESVWRPSSINGSFSSFAICLACQSIFCLGLFVRLLSYIRKPYQMAERIIKHFAIRKLHIYIFLTTNLACGLSAVDQEVLWSFSKLNNHLSSTVPSAADGLARRALAHIKRGGRSLQ